MTHYLVVAKNGPKTIKECWDAIEEHGESATSAALYIIAMQQLFPDFQYDIRQVSEEQMAEVLV